MKTAKNITVNGLNNDILNNEKKIVTAKNEIEISLKMVFNLVLNDLKAIKIENISKKQKLELLKSQYNVKNYSVKTLKAINNLIDYLMLNINIDFNEIKTNEFYYIIGAFKRLAQTPKLKNGATNKNYIQGLDKIVTKKSLENCKLVKSYEPFIKEIREYIKNYKKEKMISQILATKGV